jgi:hypothetical protein
VQVLLDQVEREESDGEQHTYHERLADGGDRLAGPLSLRPKQWLAAVAFHHGLDSLSVAVAARRDEDLAGFEWDCEKFFTLGERPFGDIVAQKAAEDCPCHTGGHSKGEDAAQPDQAAWDQCNGGDGQSGEETDGGACRHADFGVADDVNLGVTLEGTIGSLSDGQPQSVAAQAELSQVIDCSLGGSLGRRTPPRCGRGEHVSAARGLR